MKQPKRIAILATGDELINGDILNTNTQLIASSLFNNHIQPGLQFTVPDDRQMMANAMRQLLESHDGLITIGGLGPTSDDLTRFVLADVLGVELVYDETSWQQIIERFTQYDIPLSDNNRQQCYFPAGATILKNSYGTANACAYTHKGKSIFMLPGPPRECQPILEQDVLPALLSQGFSTPCFKVNWMCLGIGEAQIANKLDTLIGDRPVQVGYRADIPYLEIKLFSHDEAIFRQIRDTFYQLIKPYVISEHRETAEIQLYNILRQSTQSVTIIDNATKGYLSTRLLTPETYHIVVFPEHPMRNADITFIIEGLYCYWENKASSHYVISLLCLQPGKPAKGLDIKIPSRGHSTLAYATQFICWNILKFF